MCNFLSIFLLCVKFHEQYFIVLKNLRRQDFRTDRNSNFNIPLFLEKPSYSRCLCLGVRLCFRGVPRLSLRVIVRLIINVNSNLNYFRAPFQMYMYLIILKTYMTVDFCKFTRQVGFPKNSTTQPVQTTNAISVLHSF